MKFCLYLQSFAGWETANDAAVCDPCLKKVVWASVMQAAAMRAAADRLRRKRPWRRLVMNLMINLDVEKYFGIICSLLGKLSAF